MKNIESATSFVWGEDDEPKRLANNGESSLEDAFPDLFSDEDLNTGKEVSFERTRALIQEAETDTGADYFDGVELFIAEISPKLAEELLSLNMENNRPVGEGFILDYSKLMKEGRWGLSAPLIFSNTGYLIDGQHRLSAVVRAKSSQRFVVIIGLPDTVSTNIDRGRKRTTVDVSRMYGLTWVDSKHTSAAAFMQAKLSDARVYHPKKTATEDLVIFLGKYRNGLEFAVNNLAGNGIWNMGGVLAVIAKAYYCRTEERDRLKEFCACVKNKRVERGNIDNAAVLFNGKLSDLRADRDSKGGRVWSVKTQTLIIQYCQTALFHFLNEVDLKQLHAIKKELFPLIADIDCIS